MKPTTSWIRAVAVRFCRRTTMEQLVDPILADIELECRDASHDGVWRARWVLVRGCAGLCTATALHLAHVTASALMLVRPTRRTMRFSGAAFVLGTLGFILPPLLDAPWVMRYPDLLVVYLVPQAIPLSIPIALSFGILCGWSRNTTGRAMLRRILVLGIAGALIALATMEWLVPAANQAFRVTVHTRLAEARSVVQHAVPRGISERSISELAALVRLTSETRPFSASEYEEVRAVLQGIAAPRGGELTTEDLKLQLHARVALCFATLSLGALAVAVASAIGRPAFARIAFAAVVYLYVDGYVVVAGMAPTLPPVVSAWLPNAGVAAISVVLFGMSSRPRAAREPVA